MLDAAGTPDGAGSTSEDGGLGGAPPLRQRLLLGHTAAVTAIGLGEAGTLLASAQDCRFGTGGADSSGSGGASVSGGGGGGSGSGGGFDISGTPSHRTRQHSGDHCGSGVGPTGAALLLWDLCSGKRMATLSGDLTDSTYETRLRNRCTQTSTAESSHSCRDGGHHQMQPIY